MRVVDSGVFMSQFGDDIRYLMALHNYVHLLCRAGNPEHPEVAELMCHEIMNETFLH